MKKRKFNVTTESSSDAGIKKVQELDVDFISYSFADGENKYEDKMSEKQNLWYLNKMKEGVVFKTSQLNEYQYEEFFRNEAKKGLPIIHVALCEGLSNSVNNAREAARKLKDENIDVRVIDATVGSLASLMLAELGANLRDEGKEIDEVEKILNKKAKCIHTYYTTDDLTFFARGGRLSKGAALISKVLHINVILNTDKVGHLLVAYKVRGRKNAFNKIVNLLKEEVRKPEEQTLYVLHGDALDEAKALVEDVAKEAKFKKVEYFLMGPTIGSHAGPGLISLFYFGEEK